MSGLVSPSPNLQLPSSPAPQLPLSSAPTPCDYSPAELSHKASAGVFRRDAPPPGMQGLHEW